MIKLFEINHRFPKRSCVLTLLLCATVLIAAAVLRSTEYDENYSVFVTGGTARPEWPEASFVPNDVRDYFLVHATFNEIIDNLLKTDVHPPLYFLALGSWRHLAGNGLFSLRMLSVIFGISAVFVWILTAWRVGLSPLMVGLLISFSYGFGYTGHIARGFALAHLLIAVTVFAVVEVVRSGVTAPRSSLAWAAIAGLAAGLAAMTNYLAVFPAAAVLAWVFFAVVSWKRRLWIVLTAGIPFAMTMIISLYFFAVQKDSRTGQFEPFSPFSMLARLAQFNMANLFGGLPLYVEGAARTAVGGSLAVLLLVVVAAAAYRWRQLGQTRWLWLSGALAPSAGLVGLGIAFGNSPVELRYVAFAAPFAAMLIASAATAWGRLAPVATAAVLGLVLTVQFAGTLGMQLHSATQQPFRLAIAAASPYLGDSSVLLVPFGNDGVGITGSVVREISPAQSVLTMSNTNAQSVPLRASAYKRAVMFGVSDRDGREQINVASAALRGHPSWCSSGIVWHDFRGGYIEVFDHVLPYTSCPVR